MKPLLCKVMQECDIDGTIFMAGFEHTFDADHEQVKAALRGGVLHRVGSEPKGLLLSEAEKQRFCEYLRAQCEGDKAIIGQMERMKLPLPLLADRKAKLGAKLIVLGELENMEVQSV